MKQSIKIVVAAIVTTLACGAFAGELPLSKLGDKGLEKKNVAANDAATLSEVEAPLDVLVDDLEEEEVGESSEALLASITVPVTCNVIKARENAFCPSQVVGRGWTRWPFTNYNKGCNRGIEDARGQLSEGCLLGACHCFRP